MNIYEWRNGLKQRPDCTAEEAAQELERIRSRNNGELSAAVVVKEAAKKRHKFHGFFEWQDEIAGKKWREAQARTLIGGIVVKMDESNQIRAFQHVRIETEGTREAKPTTVSYYTSTEDALADPEKRKYILQRALNEAQSWRERYQSLSELSGVFKQIAAARDEHLPDEGEAS